MSKTLSIIIPVLNEAGIIVSQLGLLQPLREQGVELILVDGGSFDGTLQRGQPMVDVSLSCAPGRARQMNKGAAVAQGNYLLFLHIDTCLPAGLDRLPQRLQQAGTRWGFFRVRLGGSGRALRIVERMMNWRSRWTAIATGDQALFMERTLFEEIGGYEDISLMEDLALSTLLKRRGVRPLCMPDYVQTSSRRWEENGVWRTIGLMWLLRFAYFCRVDPVLLHRRYYRPKAAPELNGDLRGYSGDRNDYIELDK